MRITVEPPQGWGPKRLVLVALEGLGYKVTEYLINGDSVLELN